MKQLLALCVLLTGVAVVVLAALPPAKTDPSPEPPPTLVFRGFAAARVVLHKEGLVPQGATFPQEYLSVHQVGKHPMWVVRGVMIVPDGSHVVWRSTVVYRDHGLIPTQVRCGDRTFCPLDYIGNSL